MTYRPIIVTAESVRAILDGTKTQTRRVIKPQPPSTHRAWGNHCEDGLALFTDHPTQGEKGNVVSVRCPYGAVGDRLWVRETWGFSAKLPASTNSEMAWLAYSDLRGYRADNPNGNWCWKSPMFMPRWASRITLEITNVRVERLFDISQEDAQAEGVSIEQTRTLTHRGAFAITWDKINKKRGYGWEGGTNPWVWAITFRRVTP